MSASANVRRVRERLAQIIAPQVCRTRTEGPDPLPQAPQRTPSDVYEALYEAHTQLYPDDEVVGAGGFDLIGRKELALAQLAGLKPTGTLVDLGCGVGRMASHAVPYLSAGRYIGIDVAPSMLRRAEARIEPLTAESSCEVSWVKQVGTVFELPDQSVDVFCAYSVFTHIEHEDTYNFLKDARRAVRPGGCFVFSCLPMELSASRDVFTASAAMDYSSRWNTVRNVTTSVDYMDEISRLAGWQVQRWFRGDEENLSLDGKMYAFGQSVCVIEAPSGGPQPARSVPQ